MSSGKYLESFLRDYGYPEDAIAAYFAVHDALDAECQAEIDRAVEMLFAPEQDQKAILAILSAVAEKISIPAYTVNFYAFAIATERLRALLSSKGISEDIIYNSLRDFRYKNDECYMFTGVYGSYSDGWLMDWFKGGRLALGRLQFELSKLQSDSATVGGREYKRGDTVVGVHIPRSPDPFDYDAQIASYKMAYEYFKDSFEDEFIPFTCGSWLLYHYNKEILREGSNTLTFASFYKVMWYAPGEVWVRFIFGKVYDGNPDALPEQSSLHRGYKKYIKEGNLPGSGYGIFLFNGDTVLND